MIKRLERRGKHWLSKWLLARYRAVVPVPTLPRSMQRIGVFRLDQRIGNGILLLPLLATIRHYCPQADIHVLVHAPVADLLEQTAPELKLRIWPYRQAQLLHRPWRLAALLLAWRRLRLDVLLSATNPDRFSLSQALWATACAPRCAVGFASGPGRRVYHKTVSVAPGQPYASAMAALWQAVQPGAVVQMARLTVPRQRIESIRRRFPNLAGGVCLWLGATGAKALPPWLVEKLVQAIPRIWPFPIRLLAGPHDHQILAALPTTLRERVQMWQEPLIDTAALFSTFQLFVSADTGPRHLAIALQVPSLGLFHHSNIHQYGYAGEGYHRALQLTGHPRRDWQNIQAQLKRMGAAIGWSVPS